MAVEGLSGTAVTDGRRMRPRGRRALVYGYHGKANLGDDIFLRVISNWLVHRHGVRDLWVSASPGSLPHWLEGVPLTPIFSSGLKSGRFAWLHVFWVGLRCDVLVLAAGSIFRVQPFFLATLVLWTLKRLRGEAFPILALGVSIDAQAGSWARFWQAALLRRLDFLGLRDFPSYKRAKASAPAVHAFMGNDLALLDTALAPPAPDEVPGNDEPRREKGSTTPGATGSALPDRRLRAVEPGGTGIPGQGTLADRPVYKLMRPVGVCVTDFENSEAMLPEHIAGALLALAEGNSGFTVRLFVVCTDPKDGDDNAAERVLELLAPTLAERVELVHYNATRVEEIATALGACGTLVTSRLHAGVVAWAQGVPTLWISPREKVAAFAEVNGVDPDRVLVPKDANEERILGFLERALEAGVVKRPEPVAAMARAMLRAADPFLDRPVSGG